MNFPDERAVRSEHVDSVETFPGPPRGRPDVAVHIAPDPVGRTRRHIHKESSVLQPNAVYDVIDSNRRRVAGMFWNSRIHDVEFFLVGRKTKAIRLIHV